MVTMPPQPVQVLQTQTKLGAQQQQQLQNQHNIQMMNPPTQTIVSSNQISKCCWHSRHFGKSGFFLHFLQ